MRYPLMVMLMAGAAPALTAQARSNQPAATLVVGTKDFQQLRWIEGKWHGTNDAGRDLYQRFHFTDDSTIEVETFSSGKAKSASSRESYELRGGRVASHGASGWVLDGLDTASASFRPPAGAPGTLIWRRESSDAWLSVRSWPPTPDKPASSETWHMKKTS